MGAVLEPVTCWRCGTPAPEGFSYCGRCGARLDAPEPLAAGTDGASRGPSLDTPGDRRTVSVVFADLSGFTSLAEQLDPEELTGLVQESLGELMEEVRSHEGGMVRQIGDAIMAVFGAPETHEDDPVRAVQAALGMQHRMLAVNRRLGPKLTRPLKLHVGVNTGLVVMGRSIEGASRDAGGLTVLGDAVNVASRLQDLAGPGQVLVGGATYAATEWAFEYRALSSVALKGRQEKVEVFECLGARAQPLGDRGVTRGIASRLRGRERQLGEIKTQLDRLRERQGGILCVVGEAGVGKSRLMTEARRLPAAEGLVWLEGRSSSAGMTESYRPFAEIVRAAVGVRDGDDEELSWRKLYHAVTRLLTDEAQDVGPYLATLAGIEVQGPLRERVRYLDGDAMGRQIFRSSRRFFRRLSHIQPVVLVFEDWHWADESSAALLEHLLPLVETAPLLVCCVTRPDPGTPGERLREVGAREHPARCVVLELEPLAPPDARQLIDDLLENASPKTRELILRRSEGNPFFLEEIVRSLIDTNVAVPSGTAGRWRLTGDVEAVSIPDTIEGIIMARFQRLEEGAKQLLRAASVVGRTFDYDVVRSILRGEEDLDRRLEELVRLELIRHQADSTTGYTFKHALTHETVYESMLHKTRRELHRRVGKYLERAHGDRLEEYYSVLAYHFARAEDWKSAHEYLMKAADHAGRMAADAESLTLYREAIAAYGRAFGEQWDPLQRASLERKMGEALFRVGRNDQARELMEDAVRILGRPFPTSPPRVRNAIMRQVLKRVGRPFLPSFWLPTPADLRARAEELDRIYEAMAWIDYWVDSERFMLDCFMRLRVAERTGNKRGIAGGAAAVGLVLDHVPLPRLAERYHRRAVATAEQTQDPTAVATAYLGLGYHTLHTLGLPSEGIEHYSRAIRSYWDAGDLRRWGTMMWGKAGALRRQGRFADSMDLCHEILRVGDDAADRQILGWGIGELGRCRLELGFAAEAVPLVEESARSAEQIPDYQALVAAWGTLGRALLELERVEEAVETLERAAETIERRRLRGAPCTEPRLALPRAYLLLAERSDGATRKEALSRAERACQSARKSAEIDREAVPGAYRHLGTLGWLRGDRRSAVRSWRRSIAAGRQQGARYEQALTLLELGARTGDESSSAEGRGLLAELRDLEETAGDVDRSAQGAPVSISVD